VQWHPPHRTANAETFSIHPVVNSDYFLSFGKRIMLIESDRPLWRNKGVKPTRRPNYKIIEGDIKRESYREELFRALDEWVEKNLDA
jgi:hypothetical protein